MAKEFDTLPEIKAADIEKSKDDAWDFLHLFVHKYYEMMDKKPEITQKFNDSQNTLLAYWYLDCEVCNGGFIQLIYNSAINGYGAYIFDNPFSGAVKSWGAIKTVELVEKAKILYEKNKEELENANSTEEFSDLYKKFKDFDTLDHEYYKIRDEEEKIVKRYVEENINEFAKII